MSDGGRTAGGDKWRRLRDVLAQRTPGALIWVDRGGATFRTANGDWTMRLAVSGAGTDPERRDADLAALSILWNCADELLAGLATGEPVEGESVDCENCGETVALAGAVPSPYEADDGGSYCPSCAAKGWAHDVELRGQAEAEAARERARAATLRRAEVSDALDQIAECGESLATEPPGTEAASIYWLGIDQGVKALRAALAADAPGDAGEGGANGD